MKNPTPSVLILDGELTIYRAQEVRECLLQALGQAVPGLALDLSGVSEMDSSAVQLLLAARLEAQAAGRRFAVVAASEAVQQVLALLGLESLLQEPVLGEAA